MVRLAPSLLASMLLVGACSEPPARPRRAAPRPDKARLYGDAGLVPTREGERARRELARAGEIERALGLLPEVRRARVDLELQDDDTVRSVLVVVDAAEPNDELESTVRTIVTSVAGPDADEATELIVREHVEAPSDATPPWALMLTILGLGVSLGISYERGRRVLARRSLAKFTQRPSRAERGEYRVGVGLVLREPPRQAVLECQREPNEIVALEVVLHGRGDPQNAAPVVGHHRAQARVAVHQHLRGHDDERQEPLQAIGTTAERLECVVELPRPQAERDAGVVLRERLRGGTGGHGRPESEVERLWAHRCRTSVMASHRLSSPLCLARAGWRANLRRCPE